MGDYLLFFGHFRQLSQNFHFQKLSSPSFFRNFLLFCQIRKISEVLGFNKLGFHGEYFAVLDPYQLKCCFLNQLVEIYMTDFFGIFRQFLQKLYFSMRKIQTKIVCLFRAYSKISETVTSFIDFVLHVIFDSISSKIPTLVPESPMKNVGIFGN